MYKNFQKSTNNISAKYSFLASFCVVVFLFTFIGNTAYGETRTMATNIGDNDKIKKLDSDGNIIYSFNKRDGVQSLYEAAVDSIGNIYVKGFEGGNNASYFIDQFRSDGTFLNTIKNEVFNESMHIAVDRSNNVYISNRDEENNNVIYKMNSNGQIEVYASYSSEGSITKMTVDKNGNIYVIDGNNVKK